MSAAPERPSSVSMSAAPELLLPPPSSVAMSAAPFPNWLMLDPFVFRRDDTESFPDDTKAPIRASGVTSWEAPFRIAFCLAEPPFTSRLYAALPDFPDPRKQTPLAILASHRHLLLLRIGIDTPALGLVQNFLIYSANDTSSLKVLPPCTEPDPDYSRLKPRARSLPKKREQRLLAVKSMGLLYKGEGKHEFAVAELSVFKSITSKLYADICLLRSNTSAGPVLDGQWKSMRLEILDIKGSDPWQLCCWLTDTVIPFNRSLCWIDYNRGILSCDVFGEPTPSFSFIPFPLDEFPCAHARHQINPANWLYRGVCAINDGGELKFVKVTRHDGISYGELEPGSGFTITCHTLLSGSIQWTLDYEITSAELWSTNPPKHLPHTILMCPQVNIDRPQVVHFLISEFEFKLVKKMWVVTIDMSTKTVESLIPYINGKEGLKTDDADLTIKRSRGPMPFLPCEFSRFLHLSSPPIKNDEACSTNAWKLKEGVQNN